jgi:hypothetical protein
MRRIRAHPSEKAGQKFFGMICGMEVSEPLDGGVLDVRVRHRKGPWHHLANEGLEEL